MLIDEISKEQTEDNTRSPPKDFRSEEIRVINTESAEWNNLNLDLQISSNLLQLDDEARLAPTHYSMIITNTEPFYTD